MSITKKTSCLLVLKASAISELALEIQDVLPYNSEEHSLAERIYDLASKLEEMAEEKSAS